MSATVTPSLVKELREKTGAGMADCKKALDETGGDMNAAIEFLRKRGAASAAKRAERSANEGIVVARTTPDGTTAVILEINCETDFVARNSEFVEFANQTAETLLSSRPSSGDEIWQANIGTKTLGDLYNEILAKFAEKIELRRSERLSTDGFIAEYNHNGSRLSVLVEVDTPLTSDASKQAVRDIAMQIAALNPMYANRDQVDEAAINKEKEIYREQAEAEGKKPEIAERIANGRLEKFYQENCLTEQTFVKDAGKTVSDVLKDVSKAEGKEVKIRGFRRYMLGESMGE